MPPRLCCWLIVAFWLATTGWLCWRDVGPALRPGQPPPFTIDLADEAQLHAARIRWVVLRGAPGEEKKIGRARTWVKYRPDDDTFEMHNELNDLTLKGLVSVHVNQMTSMYRVRADGSLREMTTQLQAKVVFLRGVEIPLAAQAGGLVEGGEFRPHGLIESPAFGKIDPGLKPVPVSAHAAVLNPLHPVNRISGLRPGQRWRVPVVNPLSDAVAARAEEEFKFLAPRRSGPAMLDALVLPQLETLTWENREVHCLVIEYQGADMTARTWVRQRDGLVIRQEASLLGEASALGERVIWQRESLNP